MAYRAAAALVLREGDREELSRLMRSTAGRAGLAQRARIVLLAADGSSNTAIADKVGVSRPTVLGWRGRYDREGVDGAPRLRASRGWAMTRVRVGLVGSIMVGSCR